MALCPTCSGRTRVLRQLKGFTRTWLVVCERCEGTGTVVDWADWVVFAQASHDTGDGGSEQFHTPTINQSLGGRDNA